MATEPRLRGIRARFRAHAVRAPARLQPASPAGGAKAAGPVRLPAPVSGLRLGSYAAFGIRAAIPNSSLRRQRAWKAHPCLCGLLPWTFTPFCVGPLSPSVIAFRF